MLKINKSSFRQASKKSWFHEKVLHVAESISCQFSLQAEVVSITGTGAACPHFWNRVFIRNENKMEIAMCCSKDILDLFVILK